MSRYTATVRWTRGGAKFVDNRYSRRHAWQFDGGALVTGSSSPHSVPLPYSDAAAVDPEEAFVAAISSTSSLLYRQFGEVDDRLRAALNVRDELEVPGRRR